MNMKIYRALLPAAVIGLILSGVLHHNMTMRKYGSYENRKEIRRVLEKHRKHPRETGWEEQLRREKLGSSGVIPYGVIHKWLEQDAALARLNDDESPFSAVEELGPASVGGRTRAIHIDPVNPNRVIAGGISGGIWISGDRGVNWTVLNDRATNLTVSSITYNPFNPRVIYYSTGEARGGGGIGEGIFRSVDNGASFEVLPSSLGIEDFRYTWKIAHSLTDSNTVFVGTYRGLYRSVDSGASWQKVLDVSGEDANDVLTFDDGSVMAAMEGRGIYTSPSGNAGTFIQVSNSNFPDEYTRIKLAYCASQQNVIYAMFAVDISNDDAPEIFRSLDKGLTWQKRATPLTFGTQRRYNMMLGVHPDNPNKVVCGTVLSNYSDNGGASWFFTGLSHSDYHEYVYFPDNHNQFLIGNDGGIYLHRWNDILLVQDRNRGYNVTQFYGGGYHPEEVVTLGGTQDNGTIMVKPGGQFTYIFGADGGYAHVDQQFPITAYYSTQNDGLFRTDSWNDGLPVPVPIMYPPMANEGVSFINAYEMNYADGRQLYYKTDKGIWRTANRGGSWQRMGPDTISSILRLTVSTEADPYLYFAGVDAGDNNLLYRNTDALTGDDHAAFLNTGAFGNLFDATSINIDIHPHNNNRILFSYYNYTGELDQCWMVPDTWDPSSGPVNVTGNLPENLPVNVLKFHPYRPDSIFLAGTDFGLYYTLDAGQSWHKEERLPNVQIFDMRIRPSDGKVFLYTFGRGIWAATLRPAQRPSAVLPHTEGLASGNWSAAAYADRSSGNGRVKVTPRDSTMPTYFVSLDMSSDNGEEGSCSFIIDVDPGGAASLRISYFYFLHGGEVESPSSGVYIRRHSDGIETQVRAFQDLETSPSGMDDIVYSPAGTGKISIRFEYTGRKEIPAGGISLSEMAILPLDLPSPAHDDLSSRLKVYPNPAASMLFFEQLPGHSIDRVELCDISGAIRHSWNCRGTGTERLSIPSGIVTGNYILRFSREGRWIGNRRISIVQ